MRRDHLRVLRASAFICVKTFLVLQHHKAGNAGRDRARTQPAQAAAGARLIGRDHCAGVPAHPAGSRDSVWVGEIGRFFSLPHGTGPSECKVPAGCTSRGNAACPRNPPAGSLPRFAPPRPAVRSGVRAPTRPPGGPRPHSTARPRRYRALGNATIGMLCSPFGRRVPRRAGIVLRLFQPPE